MTGKRPWQSLPTGLLSSSLSTAYLDPLSQLAGDLSVAERSSLIELDRALHRAWRLGENVILNWSRETEGIGVVVIPHYAVAEYSSESHGRSTDETARPTVSEEFIKTLIGGRRELSREQIRKVARILGVDVSVLPLARPVSNRDEVNDLIEQMVKRYSITFVSSRAVALFDIVGFSLLSPFEQMTQLNSLSYSLNSAYSKMLSQNIGINFARSTTGDGFYIWNREVGAQADTYLYHFMHLVLADNAIARQKARQNTVPLLRTCFHLGSCYEFHQAEGLNPTLYNYIVGDVTIELARMIEHALPGQIFVGEFRFPGSGDGRGSDTVNFVEGAQTALSELDGLELSGERIRSIKCYLTGARQDGGYAIRRLTLNDKHGLSRHAFNAKVNIYRQGAEPILLGIEDRVLAGSSLARESEQIAPPVRQSSDSLTD